MNDSTPLSITETYALTDAPSGAGLGGLLDQTIVAFDTETSGAYPLESEVIELGAIKFLNGQVIDRYQTLLKPKRPLTPENMRIHGITNEMVADAPTKFEKMDSFKSFLGDSILLAHHAPFDLGFVTVEFEESRVELPKNRILCTSLLSRALLTTTNHKLQTLVKELKLVGGDAHRAADDAFACLQVFLECVKKLDPHRRNFAELQKIQGKSLSWQDYRLLTVADQKIATLAKLALCEKSIEIIYDGGSQSGKPRPIIPHGIVRNPDGDYLNAFCLIDKTRKRFYLSKITDYPLF